MCTRPLNPFPVSHSLPLPPSLSNVPRTSLWLPGAE
uniref:Uncharacterized protein n=1 Tax=Anguilla anguilla TaxID=7936 RepID=A0A0E9QRG1_ANGAN